MLYINILKLVFSFGTLKEFYFDKKNNVLLNSKIMINEIRYLKTNFLITLLIVRK